MVFAAEMVALSANTQSKRESHETIIAIRHGELAHAQSNNPGFFMALADPQMGMFD
jgi:hypothetical protein